MLATLATLVGHPLKTDDAVDSFNMLPALVGNPETPIRDHLVMAPFRKANLVIRSGRWVYFNGNSIPAESAIPQRFCSEHYIVIRQ